MGFRGTGIEPDPLLARVIAKCEHCRPGRAAKVGYNHHNQNQVDRGQGHANNSQPTQALLYSSDSALGPVIHR
ncbi:MAG: hypothetical protein AMXMBFR33_20610 [Candidatus Xenobia bacterium]